MVRHCVGSRRDISLAVSGMNERPDRPAAVAMAAALDEHPDFRVLRRLDTAREYPALNGKHVSRAVILDTETTGMDPTADKVIELGLVLFEYSRDSGEIGRVLGTYNGLEDPGMPIPAESTRVHGITDAMVQGKRIDDAAVADLLEDVGIVIAHNAAFDRPFVEARLPQFSSMAWGCSWQELPWDEAGIASAKLEYLAYRFGFFYEGHRAEIDCLALLEVLRRPFGETGKFTLKVLLDNARKPSCRLWAAGSPFEAKDRLKARSYRWEAARKTWYLDLPQEAVADELQWLKADVYSGRSASLELEEFNARTRYSGREGRKEVVRT